MTKQLVNFEVEELSTNFDSQSFPFRFVFTIGQERFKVTGNIDRSYLFQSKCSLFIYSRSAQNYNLIEKMIPSEIERISNGHWGSGPAPDNKLCFWHKGQTQAIRNLLKAMVERAKAYA